MEIRQISLSDFPFRRYTWPLFGLEVQFAGDASVAVAENCRGNDGMAAEVSWNTQSRQRVVQYAFIYSYKFYLTSRQFNSIDTCQV